MLKEVLTVSALIAVVLLVRAIFKNRVPKRMIYCLWLVVLLKLCLPGTLVSLPVLPAENVGCSDANFGAARADYAGDPAAGTNRDAAANTRAAARFPRHMKPQNRLQSR